MSFLSLRYMVALSVSRTADAHAHTQVSTLPLVFVNIKPQNDYLNMNAAFLCVYEWRSCAVLFTTRTEARVALPVILTSAVSLMRT